jgi:hypothetical protein
MFTYVPNNGFDEILNKFDELNIEEKKEKTYSYEKKVMIC